LAALANALTNRRSVGHIRPVPNGNGNGGGEAEPHYWYHTDHLGTPYVVTDIFKNTVWKISLDPFGESVSEQISLSNELRFPGQVLDRESGLNYNWNRYYQSKIGRYYQVDGLGFTGAIELYQYSRNNSLRFTDPKGLLSYEQIKSLVVANNFSGNSNELITCVIWKESSFNPGVTGTPFRNRRGVPQVARGLMQVTQDAAKDAGFDYNRLFDPAYNIQAGSTYLKLRIEWEGGNTVRGLNGYGTGPGYANNILKCVRCLKDKGCAPQECLNIIHR